MKNYIHDMGSFPELFDKISYEEEKLWIPYTVMLIDIMKKEKMEKFWPFLLKYLEPSDTIYFYAKTKFLIVFEETAIRWALLIDEKFRRKMKKHGCSCKYYSSAVQWHSIDDIQSLEKSLKKRLKKAKKCKKTDFIHSLSTVDWFDD
jgi:hypothetical protein